MHRLKRLCQVLWTTWLLLATGLAGTGASDPSPPNVVFILADDLGWGELGCYGQQRIPTPNIDRLAAEGMRFTRHYSGAPVCAPSRCVLLTGRHLGHAEIRGNRQASLDHPRFTEGQHPLSEAAETFAMAFQRAGHATAAMGKWGLGPVGSTGDPNRKGFDLFFGYNCQAVAHSYYPSNLWRNASTVPLNASPVPGHRRQPDSEVRMKDWIGRNYAPSAIVAEAERFIAANHARPFLLFLPFIEPHVALHPPAELVERFPADWDPRPYRGESSYLPHPRPRAAYAALITSLDRHVGRILDALDRHGLARRTLVIFTSDNGTTHPGAAGSLFHIGGVDPGFFNSTAGLRGYKGSVLEGGIRVPLLVRFPGRIQAGAVNHTPCHFADWFPTLCEVARLPPPARTDGVSLWPLLQGAPLETRPPMVWVFPEYGGQVAVRIGPMKVLRQRIATRDPGPWEIYDVESDPGETRNLAASHPAVLREAIDILRRQVDPNPTFPLPIPGLDP